jgi:hypothetical protein
VVSSPNSISRTIASGRAGLSLCLTVARDLPKQVRSEIEKFFVATDELEDKELKFLGWKGRKTGSS